MLEGCSEGGRDGGADVLKGKSRFGGEASGLKVLGEGGAQERAVDEDVEWDWSWETEHGLGVQDLGEVVSADIWRTG